MVTSNPTPGPLPIVTTEDEIASRSNNQQTYVYHYGIKNIGLSHSAYSQNGVFVSKPIEVDGNIIEVSLSTSEEHPLFDELSGMATDRMTSIEYYIALEENPSLNDWIAILPEEVTTVKCEKLFFNGSSAKLRFHADIHDISNTNIYKNGMILDKANWYFTEQGATIQLSIAVEYNAIYTIDYVPDFSLYDPHHIKVGELFSKKIRKVESFKNGTDANNTIKLSKYPFVDYTLINGISGYDANTNNYRPIDVFLKEGSITIGSGRTKSEIFPMFYDSGIEYVTKNRTDYKTSKDVPLRPYSIETDSLYKIFEYKQEKNKLIFTESFNRSNLYYNEATNHGNATLEIHYDYLVTDFRLKIILRKNSGDDLVATPTVDSYQLKFKVMK